MKAEETVIENVLPYMNPNEEGEARRFLSDFLFRTNSQVNTIVKNLSGGEKARLSLAIICLKSPALLILDEITNNIDINTKKHIINVLNEYKGGLIVISHDDDFVSQIHITKEYDINK